MHSRKGIKNPDLVCSFEGQLKSSRVIQFSLDLYLHNKTQCRLNAQSNKVVIIQLYIQHFLYVQVLANHYLLTTNCEHHKSSHATGLNSLSMHFSGYCMMIATSGARM